MLNLHSNSRNLPGSTPLASEALSGSSQVLGTYHKDIIQYVIQNKRSPEHPQFPEVCTAYRILGVEHWVAFMQNLMFFLGK